MTERRKESREEGKAVQRNRERNVFTDCQSLVTPMPTRCTLRRSTSERRNHEQSVPVS